MEFRGENHILLYLKELLNCLQTSNVDEEKCEAIFYSLPLKYNLIFKSNSDSCFSHLPFIPCSNEIYFLVDFFFNLFYFSL